MSIETTNNSTYLSDNKQLDANQKKDFQLTHMKKDKTEIERIRERYARREEKSVLYNPLLPHSVCVRYEKMQSLVQILRPLAQAHGSLGNIKLLEVGCGTGGNFLELIQLGFNPENLVGNELLETRAAEAIKRLPKATVIHVGDAVQLTLPKESFDIVFQSTVFSSILDDTFQQKLADCMWALVKPGGGVLWYDFVYDNPKNTDVKGVPVKRIRRLFPEGELNFRRVTLAPPIGRLVAKIHPSLYAFLKLFPFLRTHVFCWIQKKE